MLFTYVFPFTTNVRTSSQDYYKPSILCCYQETGEILLSCEIILRRLRLMYIPRHIPDVNSDINKNINYR